MTTFTNREKVTLLRDFLNVVGTETEGVEVKITRDADNGMRFYAEPQVLVDVKNDSGAQIDKGTPVYVSGEHGGSGKPTIEKAQADAAATMPAIGLLLTDLADGAEGYVLAAGTLLNLDTDTPAWDAGDALYVSPTTAGELTRTRPTGDTELVQKVALVTRRHATAGSVIVMGAGRTNDTPNDSYHGRYNTEAAARTVANGDFYVELFYTARPDGDGLDEDPQSDAGVPALSYVERRLYFSDKFNADPTVSSDWTAYTTQPADDTSYADAKTALLAGLNDTDATANTRGTLPLSLKIERKVTSDLLLEDYPGAVLACSVRKISGAYTGDCMTVRRASDNTEQDIGFDASGNLDTAAIATFCGTSNGYVSKWYDQSGNSNDWVQTGASSQPQIYDGSQVLKVNTKPSIRFFNTPSYMQQGTQALPTSGGYAFAMMGVNPTATDRAFGVIGSNNAAVVAGLARDGNTGANVIGMTVSGYYVNGTQITSPNQDKLYDATQQQGLIHLADYANTSGTNYNYWPSYPHLTFYANAQMQEFIAYHSDQSSNQSAIESDIDTYYKPTTALLIDTYGGAAAAYSVRKLSQWYTGNCMKVRRDSDDTTQDIGFDSNGDLDTAAIKTFCDAGGAGTLGYVDTWYDQSGNGYNMTQSTASQQPQIYDGSAVITEGGKPAITPSSSSPGSRMFSTLNVASASVYGFNVMRHTSGLPTVLMHSSPSYTYMLASQSGSTSTDVAGQGLNWRKDGASWTFLTRNDVYGSLNSAHHLIAFDGAMASNWTSVNLGDLPVYLTWSMYQMQELVVYTSDQSSNRSGIESDINAYFSIY